MLSLVISNFIVFCIAPVHSSFSSACVCCSLNLILLDFFCSLSILCESYFYFFIYLFIYNIRRIARLFPTVHYALNLRDAARNEFFEKVMERRYDFRCRRKPKCSEKTCAGKYGSRTKFTYDSGPTGNRTRAALVKGTGTTAAPTRPSMFIICQNLNTLLLQECLSHDAQQQHENTNAPKKEPKLTKTSSIPSFENVKIKLISY